ncbi:glycosyltransferase family 2 protein [Gymnodinialimonas sp. 2305UL16-5]|uniref:glycosyltransferase family 2 protein n=1 Tax=Gymnodinialimonas mytili TaxID=3126503 RepID=UPI0030AA14D0
MTHAETKPAAAPIVSVIMAFHNAGPYLEEAMASVLNQSLSDIELILSDDASTDGSLAVAERAAARDRRVRVVTSQMTGGPAAARNRALDVARGEWIAIVDADDLLHPARLERLIEQARVLNVDIVADDLIHFGGESGKSVLGILALMRVWLPSPEDLMRAESGWPPVPVGYLKPILRREVLGEMRYRSYLRVGEDFDLLLRVCLAGARLAVVPDAYYLYRRHSGSISYRLSDESAAQMLRALDELEAEISPVFQRMPAYIESRRRDLRLKHHFAKLVVLLKSRSISKALALSLKHPGTLSLLARAAFQSLTRRIATASTPEPKPHLLLTGENSSESGDATWVRVAVPEDPLSWTASIAIRVTALASKGNARLRVVGRPGLEALGFVPGWTDAELVPPPDGWTQQEAHLIASFPWPTRPVQDPILTARSATTVAGRGDRFTTDPV